MIDILENKYLIVHSINSSVNIAVIENVDGLKYLKIEKKRILFALAIEYQK